MPSQMHTEPSRQSTAQKLRHMHLGAIVDARGREIPITEQMILQACRQLERDASPLRRLFFR